MPIYLDLHTIEGGVSAADVAAAHEADLKTQGPYGVNYLRYWVDEEAGEIFCLVDAPDAEAANEVHRAEHGLVADEIYPVTADRLDAATKLAETHHWLAFLPCPQALRGEVQLARGDPAGAARLLRQAFARACRLGDPYWEGLSARALALVAEATGETGRAFEILADARVRANRLADPYVWLDLHIVGAHCELGRRHGHPDTPAWVATVQELAARTGLWHMT